MTAAIMIQLITGAIGSVGFGILFHIKKKYLPLAAVPSLAGWCSFWEKNSGEMFFFRLLALLQMCMQKFLQESVKKHLHLFCYFRNPSDSRKYSLLLYEQHCGRKYCSSIGIWTGYVSFCFWNCSRNEYCVVDLLFSENCMTWQERNS